MNPEDLQLLEYIDRLANGFTQGRMDQARFGLEKNRFDLEKKRFQQEDAAAQQEAVLRGLTIEQQQRENAMQASPEYQKARQQAMLAKLGQETDAAHTAELANRFGRVEALRGGYGDAGYGLPHVVQQYRENLGLPQEMPAQRDMSMIPSQQYTADRWRDTQGGGYNIQSPVNPNPNGEQLVYYGRNEPTTTNITPIGDILARRLGNRNTVEGIVEGASDQRTGEALAELLAKTRIKTDEEIRGKAPELEETKRKNIADEDLTRTHYRDWREVNADKNSTAAAIAQAKEARGAAKDAEEARGRAQTYQEKGVGISGAVARFMDAEYRVNQLLYRTPSKVSAEEYKNVEATYISALQGLESAGAGLDAVSGKDPNAAMALSALANARERANVVKRKLDQARAKLISAGVWKESTQGSSILPKFLSRTPPPGVVERKDMPGPVRFK